jgi:hypothetical protein
MLAEAGFAEIEITVKEESRDFIKDWSPGDAVDDFARSAYIQARKPAAHHKNGR